MKWNLEIQQAAQAATFGIDETAEISQRYWRPRSFRTCSRRAFLLGPGPLSAPFGCLVIQMWLSALGLWIKLLQLLSAAAFVFVFKGNARLQRQPNQQMSFDGLLEQWKCENRMWASSAWSYFAILYSERPFRFHKRNESGSWCKERVWRDLVAHCTEKIM